MLKPLEGYTTKEITDELFLRHPFTKVLVELNGKTLAELRKAIELENSLDD